ncbi:MAG: hypothetical protein ABEL04_00805 [Salinibacter sp.]|uniref:hypothetical protein n=1 Tax=Salinibacter sp. TaxID=2065818 RepID=UPI0035D40DE7
MLPASLFFRRTDAGPYRIFLLLLAGAVLCGCDSGSEMSGPAPTAPSVPSDLQAVTETSSGGGGIRLRWSAPDSVGSGGQLRYNVYRATDSIRSVEDRTPVNDNPVEGTAYLDDAAEPWQSYHYRVTALQTSEDQAAESSPSEGIQYTRPTVEYSLGAGDLQGSNEIFGAAEPIGDLDGDGTSELAAGGLTLNEPRRVHLISGADGRVFRALRPEELSPVESFGPETANVGDVDADGEDDLLIGTPGARSGTLEDAGRTRLLSGASGSTLWSRKSPELQDEGFFGRGTGVGDRTGDGVPDVLVSAPGESAAELPGAGRAYLLDGTDGGVVDTLVSPDPQQGEAFGELRSIPDVDGDGARDFMDAVPGRDGAGVADAGRVYLFSGAALTDGTEQALVRAVDPPNPENGGEFGGSTDLVSDVDGDGTPDLVVGASGESVDGELAGRAHLISGADGSVIRSFASPSPSARNIFGGAVRGVGDVNGDGTPDVAVQEIEAVGGVSLSGRIYL